MATMVIRVEVPEQRETQDEYLVSLFEDDGSADWAVHPHEQVRSRFEPPAPPEGDAGPPLDEQVLHRPTCRLTHLHEAGDLLSHFLLTGGVATAWYRAVTQHAAAGAATDAVRTFLDIQPPELRRWPWELMVADQDRAFLGHRLLCLRGDCTLPAAEAIPVPGRVLIVVGRGDDQDLHADDEVDRIRAALHHDHLGEWQVDLLWAPTDQKFYATFEELRPHIFHFIGHSDWTADGEPALEFRPPGGRTWYLTADRITYSFAGAAPRLVVLNACRTFGEAADSGAPPVRSVAEAFDGLGARAVISMQTDIGWEPALEFSKTVYQHLADEEAVDLAVRHGRVSLFRTEAACPKNWARPALTVHGAPEQVVAIALRQPRNQVKELMGTRYDEVATLADRRAEHRLLGAPPTWRAALVTGAAQAGKTAFVLSCVHTWRLQGSLVAYTDLTGSDGRWEWLDVVRAVRDAVTAGCPDPDRVTGHRRLFDWQLEQLGEGRWPELPAAEPALTAIRGDDWRWQPGTEDEPQLRAAALRYLRELLLKVAGDQQLILVLDPLDNVLEMDVRTTLSEHLFRPVLQDRPGRLAVLLVATTEEAKPLLPPDLRRAVTSVTLKPLTGSVQLLREFTALAGREFTGMWRTMALGLAEQGEVLPRSLQWLLQNPFREDPP
jgi:hypothetical protein